jgi:hypothetical protein
MAGAAAAGGKAAGAKSAAKAAGTVAAGGGPEDPVTDVIAVGQLAGAQGGGAPKTAAKTAGEGGDVAKSASKKGGAAPAGKKGGRGKKALGWAWSDNRKLLTAEFVVCVAVLGVGTLVSPEDSKHDVPRAMIKGSALAGIFFLLALVSSGGQKPARVANAIGTLITATYVLTSADVHNIVEWIASFFSPASAGEAIGKEGLGGDGSNGQPAGGTSEEGVTEV